MVKDISKLVHRKRKYIKEEKLEIFFKKIMSYPKKKSFERKTQIIIEKNNVKRKRSSEKQWPKKDKNFEEN